MKIIKLLLIALLFASCSTDSADDPVFEERCGSIDWKRVNIGNDNCTYEIRVESYHAEGSYFQVCIDESEFTSLQVGDEYCNGQIQIN